MLTIILAALVAWFIYEVFSFYKMVKRFPRGPFPLPFIGNLHQLELNRFYRSLEKFSEKYGSVYTVFLPTPMVVLADYESVKEAFVTKGDYFIGRPDTPVNTLLLFAPNAGVINSNGEEWREQRRVAISLMRDFGMGKNVMENQVQESIREFLRCLDEIKDKDRVDMRWPLQMMIANVINQVLFGFRYKYDDCEPLIDYVEGINKTFDDFANSKLLFLSMRFPWLRFVPVIKKHAVDIHYNNMQKAFDYIRVHVADALKNFDAENDEATCFVQAFKQKIITNPSLTTDHLHGTASDFFLAGQETTTTTLRWAVLYLADNQAVQEKMREEILSVVGKDRLPSMADKPNLPYTTAVSHEIQRLANILALNVLHKVVGDVEIQGHFIPAGALVNGDIHQIMSKDPIFKDPGRFQPERYLADDGKSLKKELIDRTVAFSLGKRQCAGEALARMELFLALSALYQNYRILPPLDDGINFEPQPKNILMPFTNYLRLEKIH